MLSEMPGDRGAEREHGGGAGDLVGGAFDREQVRVGQASALDIRQGPGGGRFIARSTQHEPAGRVGGVRGPWGGMHQADGRGRDDQFIEAGIALCQWVLGDEPPADALDGSRRRERGFTPEDAIDPQGEGVAVVERDLGAVPGQRVEQVGDAGLSGVVLQAQGV